MSDAASNAPVNSRPWWNDHFAHHWERDQQPAAIIEHDEEQRKWDSLCGSSPLQVMSGSMQGSCQELADRIEELLPTGSSVLEAGCGAGYQSVVLAQRSKLHMTLMDFAPAALQHARHSFEQRGLSGEFLCEDVFFPGKEGYDLVFNAGALEHYTFAEQVAFLRGMASRSRKYVLALVPNRQCFWYWIWRLQVAANGAWPYGNETPLADLSAVFAAAGLTFVGQWYGGDGWTEDFIRGLSGLDRQLSERILVVHRSPIVPKQQKSYLVAALGCKGAIPHVPACWQTTDQPETRTDSELTAAICDVLAGVAACERRQRQLQVHLCELETLHLQQSAEEHVRLASIGQGIEAKDAQSSAILSIRTRRLAGRPRRIRASLMPPGSHRDQMARVAINTARPMTRYLQAAYAAATKPSRATITRLVPAWSRPYLKCVENKVRDTIAYLGGAKSHLGRAKSARTLQSILDAHQARRGIVVLPPLIDWDWMKQRPHHLLTEFAQAGYLVFHCSPQTRADRVRGFQQVGESLYLCSSVKVLQRHLECPIVLATCPGHAKEVQKFNNPRVIYDHLDDLRVHCAGNKITANAITQHEELLRTAEVVCVTAEHLYMQARAIRPDAVLCPNGVHYDHFALAVAPQIPHDLKKLVADGRPIVGYYGALAKWFDYDLLAWVAHRCPQYQFVLIGPDYDRSLDQRRLSASENVHWLGEKKYEALPAYAYHFTVATIPFLINEITECTSPIKLFEYMAAGKPIVSTDLPECRKYRSVLRARTAAAFAVQLDTAITLGRDPQYRNILAEEARANTWRARFELIEGQLVRGLPRESRAA